MLIHVAMPQDAGGGVEAAQILQQGQERGLLLLRARVLCLQILIRHARAVLNATDVAHPYRVRVVSDGMGTSDIHVAAFVHGTIQIDQIVIPDVAPALRLMLQTDILHRLCLAFRRRRAVHDDLVYPAAAALQRQLAQRQEFFPRLWTTHPIRKQSVIILERLQRLLGQCAKHTILGHVQQSLQLLHPLARASFPQYIIIHSLYSF